jgi:Flp pilus assembly protein TadG
MMTKMRSSRRGTAATEFAIALPVLLLLAIGCCDLVRAVAAYICVSNAARVGAEYGATHGYTSYTESSWQSQVTQQAANEMQGTMGLNSSQLTVGVSSATGSNNLPLVTVTTSYPFSMITSWPGLPQKFNVTHSVTMQRFR